MSEALIFSIQRASFVDGPGIRTTVFFKGCNLRCLWCHNPESRSGLPQIMFYEKRCEGCGHCLTACPGGAVRADFTVDPELCRLCGKCVRECPHNARELCGQRMSVEEVLDEIVADRDFYADDGGATFSGGECMLQAPFLKEALRRCRDAGVRTAVDTAGNVPFEALREVEPWTDLFLYDIKAFSDALHRRLTGASNARILENYRKLHALCPQKMWVRIPVIPGCNVSEIPEIAKFLKAYPPKEVELLPYHAMGVSKSLALGEEPFRDETPSEAEMARLRAMFAGGAK